MTNIKRHVPLAKKIRFNTTRLGNTSASLANRAVLAIEMKVKTLKASQHFFSQ